MGSLSGHVLPGTIFFIQGFWTLCNVLRDYYRSKYMSGFQYCNRPWYPLVLCGTKIPLDSVYKILTCATGVIGEIITGFDDTGHFICYGNIQHLTMYTLFFLNGCADLLMHFNFLELPTGFEHFTLFLAFFSEGFLFYNHLHGRAPMDIQLHMLLLCLIVLCTLCVLVEMRYWSNPLAGLSRAYFVMMQGTWFYQIGFVLYTPVHWFPGMTKWDESSHQQMMLVTLALIWHLMANLLVVAFVSVILAKKMRKNGCFAISMADVEYQPISNDDNDNKRNI